MVCVAVDIVLLNENCESEMSDAHEQILCGTKSSVHFRAHLAHFARIARDEQYEQYEQENKSVKTACHVVHRIARTLRTRPSVRLAVPKNVTLQLFTKLT